MHSMISRRLIPRAAGLAAAMLLVPSLPVSAADGSSQAARGGSPLLAQASGEVADGPLEPRYPRWRDFQRIRKRLDPTGAFANEYTDRVLGPIG